MHIGFSVKITVTIYIIVFGINGFDRAARHANSTTASATTVLATVSIPSAAIVILNASATAAHIAPDPAALARQHAAV